MLFLVERYGPGLSLDRLRAAEAALHRASAASTREGRPVRYLGSTYIAAEETVFATFEADDQTSVAEVNRRAGQRFDRIVAVVDLGGRQSESNGEE